MWKHMWITVDVHLYFRNCWADDATCLLECDHMLVIERGGCRIVVVENLCDCFRWSGVERVIWADFKGWKCTIRIGIEGILFHFEESWSCHHRWWFLLFKNQVRRSVVVCNLNSRDLKCWGWFIVSMIFTVHYVWVSFVDLKSLNLKQLWLTTAKRWIKERRFRGNDFWGVVEFVWKFLIFWFVGWVVRYTCTVFWVCQFLNWVVGRVYRRLWWILWFWVR